MIRSPTQPLQPCSVGSIDSDGIRYGLATHVNTGDDLDVVDGGRVHGERALDANAVALLAHRERLAHAAALTAQHDALEDLDALLGALDDLHVHIDGVAGAEGRDVVAQ